MSIFKAGFYCLNRTEVIDHNGGIDSAGWLSARFNTNPPGLCMGLGHRLKEWETFQVHESDDGNELTWKLQSTYNNMFVSVHFDDPRRPMYPDTDFEGATVFIPIFIEDGVLNLRTQSEGKYVSNDLGHDCTIQADRDVAGDWESLAITRL